MARFRRTKYPTSPRPTRPTYPAWLAITALVLAAMALRLWLAGRNAGITMDSPLYVNMADSLAHGHRAIGPGHHGYPALIALAGLLLQGRELPGRALSLVAGVALVWLVYRLARRSLAPGWAALAAGCVALHPLLAVYSGPIMTESVFLAVTSAALLLIEQRGFLAGGLGLGLGYTIRPDALVVALGAAFFSRGGRRGAARVLLGFLAVAAAYVGFMSLERGELVLTPKTALIRPPYEHRRDVEWRIEDPSRSLGETPRGLIERIRWAAPAMATRYFPNLMDHGGRLLEVWPWPLMALSVMGLALRRGPLIGPLLGLAALPLLAVGADLRFSQLFVPALAVYAAEGSAWGVTRARRVRHLAAGALVVLTAWGSAAIWVGRPGRHALWFDDGPMAEMRAAGAWLRRHGRPGATVMDRKAYVPFYAGMRHVQLPDDDYDTVVEYAHASGVDYLVLEEYVVTTLRRQFLPFARDSAFRAREKRLRIVYGIDRGPMTAVAVMEVVREPSGEPAHPAPSR